MSNTTSSVIRRADLRENSNAYRSAAKKYYVLYLRDEQKHFLPCLLTESDVKDGVERANKNPEDILPLSWWQSLLHRLGAKS